MVEPTLRAWTTIWYVPVARPVVFQVHVGVVASVRCDALMLDDQSRSDTYPYIDIQEDDTTMTHEATVGKVSADQVFYLMSRGLTENEATNLIVQGFLEVFTKELPMEYAIEFNRLVKLEMEGSLG